MTGTHEQQLNLLASSDKLYQELLTECQKQEEDYLRIKCSLSTSDQELLDRYIALCEELEYRRTYLAFDIN